MNAPQRTQAQFVIDAAHPSLPGHFPGLPIVPGVLLLDQVIEAAEHWLAAHVYVQSMQQVKFLQALRPGEAANAILDFDGAETLRFKVEHVRGPSDPLGGAGDPVAIAQGVLGIKVERRAK